jgi:hypothetical protein
MMAYNAPVLHYTSDVITAADYNMRYYNERYLKGIDGAITLSNQLVGDAKAICSLGVGSHSHLTTGAEGGLLSGGVIAKDGYLVAGYDDGKAYFGAGATLPALIEMNGKDTATPGIFRFLTPNAAKAAHVLALLIEGCTDTPDLHPYFNILMESGKTVDGVDVSVLNARVDAMSGGEMTGSRAVDTVYQNTASFIKVVTIIMENDSDDAGYVYIGAANPPTSVVGGSTVEGRTTITFFVPVGWYYMFETTVSDPTIYSWYEWSLNYTA